MKLSQLKKLVSELEANGVTDEFNLKFVAWSNENTGNFRGMPNLLSSELEEDSSFDIGRSDKKVNIFTYFN